MRKLCMTLAALLAFTTVSFAEFITFEKSKFEALVKSNAPVVVHTHEWW